MKGWYECPRCTGTGRGEGQRLCGYEPPKVESQATRSIVSDTRRHPLEPEWHQCHYCAKHSQALIRSCCPFGRASDLKRLETSVTVSWEAEAEALLPERDGRGYPGDWIENVGEVLAVYAARVLVLLDEVGRLRECRDGMGRLVHELGEARVAFSDERSRVVEAARLLGPGAPLLALAPEADVRKVLLDDRFYYVGTTRYCALCRTSNCERQPEVAFPRPCGPLEGAGNVTHEAKSGG